MNLYDYVKNKKDSKTFSSEIPGLWDTSLVQIRMALMIFIKYGGKKKTTKNYQLSENFRKDGFSRTVKIKKKWWC